MQHAHGTEVEYRFHDVRVDTRAHSVTRAGIELALEPKAYGVLLQLLARPGAVLTRDDLLDAVWGHRHVTPAVLNRVIAMLRRELGDDADHPTTIRTVHGVGYAFIAQVTAAAASEPSVAAAEAHMQMRDVPVDEAARADIGIIPVSDEVVSPLIEDQAAASAAAPASGRQAGPRTRRWLAVVAAAVVAVVVALAWAKWQVTQQQKPAQAEVPPPASNRTAQAVTLAVLPFTSVGEDDTLRELAGGLTDSFGEALARLADVRVTAAASTAVAVAASPEPQAVARALSVGHVLGGQLRAVGPASIELQLALYTPASRDPAWSHVVRHARAQPYRMLGPALDAIASSPLSPISGSRPDPSLNASLDAQDLYWLGRQHFARRDPKSWRRAQEFFERAVEIDPGYALAWTSIAEVHRVLAITGQEPLQASARRASDAVERALALDPNLPDAYVIQSLISTMQWRPSRARAAARRALELAPNSPHVVGLNGNIEYYLGRPRAALALHERAHEGDPLAPNAVYMMAQDCVMLGDEKCARAGFEKAARMIGPTEETRTWLVRFGLAYGHLAESISAKTDEVTERTFYIALGRTKAWSMLDFDAESERALARLGKPKSAAPLYIATELDRQWRKAHWTEALQWAETVGGQVTQEPWRTIWLAQARVLAGETAAGLRDYDRTLADPANREILTYSWFPTRNGIGQVANWIALRKQSGASYQAELVAMNADIAAMAEGGVDLPAFDYHRAVAAVLSGDVGEADKRLARAIKRGWLDDVAFDTDFVWPDLKKAPWFVARRAELLTRLASERALALDNARRAAPGAASESTAPLIEGVRTR